MELLTAGEWVLVGLVVIAVAFVALLVIRGRWLSRSGGMFECTLRLYLRERTTPWMLGSVRVRGETIEWFRSLSLSFGPAYYARRGDLRPGTQRTPGGEDNGQVYPGQVIVGFHDTRTDVSGEAAMAQDALTALQAWLEAGPPGRQYQGRG